MATISIETAKSYLSANLSCLPAARERKYPTVGSWKTWATRLPTHIEVEAWFANRHDALCIVAGAVSGNLECVDFDNGGELFQAWKDIVDPGLFSALVIERTPSGGYHALYRCEGPVEGNLKLARAMREGKLKTLIETRGEGGLFLCAPSEGYELIQGRMEEIPTIPASARNALLEAARSLDEVPLAVEPHLPQGAHTGQPGAFVARPGDDFAARGDIRPYLEAAGWQFIGSKPDGNEMWRRPGKNSGGLSATFDGSVFYVFSSNAAPFESGRGYNAFQVYTLLEHDGDFTHSASALLSKGYGVAEDAMLGVSLNLNISQPVEEKKPKRRTLGELVEAYPKMKPPLIHGFLRRGETMNIIAPPKTGKSWLVTDLALAIATGSPWFGFPCEQGKVLIIDNELHGETSASRIPKVIEARGVPFAKVKEDIIIENQRGSLRSIEDLAGELEELRPYGFKLIIIDAFYRALPRGTDENDNGTVAGLYNLIDRYAETLDCAFVLIHHTSKGNQSQKAVTDVGAGAGSQSRAADAHVILRRHREQGCVVMESVVRSFPSVQPVCLRWNWPLWNRDDHLNPDDLEGKAELKRPRTGAEAAAQEENVLSKIRSLVDKKDPLPKTEFIRKIQMAFDLSRARSRELFDEAVDSGYLKCERQEGAQRSTNATKYVYLGDVDPAAETASPDDDDDSLED